MRWSVEGVWARIGQDKRELPGEGVAKFPENEKIRVDAILSANDAGTPHQAHLSLVDTEQTNWQNVFTGQWQPATNELSWTISDQMISPQLRGRVLDASLALASFNTTIEPAQVILGQIQIGSVLESGISSHRLMEALPELSHTFAPDIQQPPAVLSILFAALGPAIAALTLLMIWSGLRIQLRRPSFMEFIFLTILVTFELFYTIYWTSLRLGGGLIGATLLGIVTFLTGKRALAQSLI